MTGDIFDLVTERFLANDLAGAIAWLETELTNEPGDRFKSLLKLDFDNDPREIANAINEFASACRGSFELKSIYLEMNGFDINPDEWYFDFFGYKSFGTDPNDLEWLCEMDSDQWTHHFTLTGLEPVQEDYVWYSHERGYKLGTFKRAFYLASHLVMAKFVRLIQRTTETGIVIPGIHVLATAHDFDNVGFFKT